MNLDGFKILKFNLEDSLQLNCGYFSLLFYHYNIDELKYLKRRKVCFGWWTQRVPYKVIGILPLSQV